MSPRSTPIKRLAAVAAALPLVAVLAACGSDSEAEEAASTVTVTTAQGEVEVPAQPQTIVSYDLGTIDIIDALGGDVAGVPDATFPDYLTSVQDEAEVVGSFFEPDFEAVAELDPDLIIVSGRSLDSMDDLAEIATTIDLSVDETDYWASVQSNVEALGTILGAQDEATSLVSDVQTQIDEATEVTADAGTGLIVLTTGGEVSAYGAGSRFGIIHDLLGVEPAVDIDAETHGEPVSFEYVGEANPDWLFVIDRDAAIGETGGESAEAILDNAVVGSTTAWSEGQVIYLDGVVWYLAGGGITAMSEMVSNVTEGIES
ncbi:siderophore ABC transporter substrate-binding protein [Nocardioides bruguierae]|uniref:Siderophore ABC transporter substrate-binding protein n=1 Tax=Nocardioides bruguierae TaxID=2945102 RepID=A0A9X2D814_9ACTN|nr:siderophore ABC transporter substrate-binding protein [Nocardioides bruguierae]MCM0620734.1 siderophore ABC transporter substrate-binding protein [Nocardioides bruguierae]